jgi:hypothetical protein
MLKLSPWPAWIVTCFGSIATNPHGFLIQHSGTRRKLAWRVDNALLPQDRRNGKTVDFRRNRSTAIIPLEYGEAQAKRRRSFATPETTCQHNRL